MNIDSLSLKVSDREPSRLLIIEGKVDVNLYPH